MGLPARERFVCFRLGPIPSEEVSFTMSRHLFSSLHAYLLRMIAISAAALQLLVPSLRSGATAEAPRVFRYLAIGNSITRHPVCDIWWNEIGMAASTADYDYFHIVTRYLNEAYGDVEAKAVNFVEWETAKQDRASTYGVIEPELSEDLDLITVQLSENASTHKGLGKDVSALLQYLKTKCPRARIILVDDFWDKDKSKEKRKAARAENVAFANLKAIRGNPAFMANVGDIVFGSDGMPHVIDREDVARHPNDAGMLFIAQVIIRQIERFP